MRQRLRKYFDYDDSVIPSHFPRLLVEVAAEQCADRSGLLDQTGITETMLESPDARISLRRYARLCRNALRLTANPGLGIDLGRRVQLSNLGMLGLVAMSSPDIKTALELGLRYYRTLAPFWELSLEEKGETVVVKVREAVPLAAQHIFATEILVVSWISLGRTLIGGDKQLLGLDLEYPKPPHWRRYAEFANAPVRFGRPVTQVVLDAAALKQRLTSWDPATLRAAERQCAAELSAVGSAEGLLGSVRTALEASPGSYPGLGELARSLRTSVRTLRRGLVDMGTSYQSLVDIARCKHATELLVGTDLSINEIAEQLGFSEGRALRRAFKRWTGWTATTYRQEKRAIGGSEA